MIYNIHSIGYKALQSESSFISGHITKSIAIQQADKQPKKVNSAIDGKFSNIIGILSEQSMYILHNIYIIFIEA